MPDLLALNNSDPFTKTLYEKMKAINPGIEDLELYEFQYGLDNLIPDTGDWDSIRTIPTEEIEALVSRDDF
jgi:hypothetical protein